MDKDLRQRFAMTEMAILDAIRDSSRESACRFDEIDRRFDEIDRRFDEIEDHLP